MSKGVQYILLASVLFSLMNVCVKMVPGIPAVEVVFFRSVISLVISMSILMHQGVSIWGKKRLYLILRGVFGAIALTLYFLTLQRIPLATAVVMQFTAPIFTVLFGVLIVKERFYLLQLVFFLVSLSGVFVIRQFDERVEWIYVIAGLVASVFAGLAYNMIRKIKTDEHPLVIIMYFPLITAPLSGAWSAFHWVMPQGSEWLILLAIGILTQFAQYFMTRAYQIEELSRVASIRYVGIIWALSFGFIFFGEVFNLMTFAGMALVLAGVISNIVYKNYKDKKLRKEELNHA